MADYFFVATPYGDLEASHWRLIEGESGGPETIVFALRLRGLAAQSNRGGLVCLRTGEPMTLGQIGTYMGYSSALLLRCLDLLKTHGLACAGEEGGVRVTDPVLLQHLGRAAAAKQLPDAAKEKGKPGRKPIGKKAMTAAERSRRKRNKMEENVTECVTKCHEMSRNTESNFVTSPPEQADIVDKKTCHEMPNKREVKKRKKTTTTKERSSFFAPLSKPHPLLFAGTWAGHETWLENLATKNPESDLFLLADLIDYQASQGKVNSPKALIMGHLTGKIILSPYDGYSPEWRDKREALLSQNRENKPLPIEEIQKDENQAMAEEMNDAIEAWQALPIKARNDFKASISADSWLFYMAENEEIVAAEWYRQGHQ